MKILPQKLRQFFIFKFILILFGAYLVNAGLKNVKKPKKSPYSFSTDLIDKPLEDVKTLQKIKFFLSPEELKKLQELLAEKDEIKENIKNFEEVLKNIETFKQNVLKEVKNNESLNYFQEKEIADNLEKFKIAFKKILRKSKECENQTFEPQENEIIIQISKNLCENLKEILNKFDIDYLNILKEQNINNFLLILFNKKID
ncbi:hypothetical protein ACQ4LE_008540 [Meloidogyne hapla]